MKIKLTNVNTNAKLDGQYQLDMIPRVCIFWDIYSKEKFIYLTFLMYELEVTL